MDDYSQITELKGEINKEKLECPLFPEDNDTDSSDLDDDSNNKSAPVCLI